MAHLQLPGFWEIGCYKNNVRRIKDGIDQLDDFCKMLKERAELEAKYTKSLAMFSEKWKNHVEENVPSGSIRNAWQGIISESDALGGVHEEVRKNLMDDIVKSVSSYRKENYHNSAFRAPKECREIEDDFDKAQRHWRKLYDKMEQNKKNYHHACSAEKTAEVAVQNSKADTSISMDGAQKFQDRLNKCKEETRKTQEEYQKMLNELKQYRTPYVEGMTFVFDKCQKNELSRCKFFVEQMRNTENILVELIKNDRFVQHHKDIDMVLRSLDSTALTKDLKDWSSRNGVDAPTRWPDFEDYSPEIRNISGKSGVNKKNVEEVVLMKQTIKSDELIIPENNFESNRSERNDFRKAKSYTSETNSLDEQQSRPNSAESITQELPKNNDGVHNNSENKGLVPHASATALYDYSPLEGDEITLVRGETIVLLSHPDSLGWCTGRKQNGECGLFPATYVQVL